MLLVFNNIFSTRYEGINGTGNAAAMGSRANSITDLFGEILGGKQIVNLYNQASGIGVNDTSAVASGNGVITNGTHGGKYSILFNLLNKHFYEMNFSQEKS